MKYVFLMCFLFLNSTLNATTISNTVSKKVSIFPPTPIVMFVNRDIQGSSLYAPNTQIQINVNNSSSKEDLMIANIFVNSPYEIFNGPRSSYTTDDLIAYNFDSITSDFKFDKIDYKIPAGTNKLLGSNSNTWFFVSNMMGLNGGAYYRNQYNAELGKSITIIIAGYYIDSKGFPSKNFKEEVELNIITF